MWRQGSKILTLGKLKRQLNWFGKALRKNLKDTSIDIWDQSKRRCNKRSNLTTDGGTSKKKFLNESDTKSGQPSVQVDRITKELKNFEGSLHNLL